MNLGFFEYKRYCCVIMTVFPTPQTKANVTTHARYYAGIDEAGYGPMFGPFTVARAVVKLNSDQPVNFNDEPGCIWTLLEKGVCKTIKDKRKRIAVNDSKKLYTKAAGLSHLERGVLSFLHLAGHEVTNLDHLLETVGHDPESKTAPLMWYHNDAGGPPLPDHITDGELHIARSHLKRSCDDANFELAELTSAVVFEDRYNDLIEKTRSKARATWKFVAEHIWAIWKQFGQHHPWVVVDRQGGRKVYHQLLELMFEGADVRLLDESDNISRYRIVDDKVRTKRYMTISFETKSEERHLPTALASMTAKYLRELLMQRFNNFWRHYLPDIQPTKGYVQDGRRFLKEIEPVIAKLGVPKEQLIRSR